jgi:hypothetical protein
MNGRGLAIVFAEDVQTVKDSYHPGKHHSYSSSFIFLNRGQSL